MTREKRIPDIEEIVSMIATDFPISEEKTAYEGFQKYLSARNEFKKLHGSARHIQGPAYFEHMYKRHVYCWERVKQFYNDTDNEDGIKLRS